MLFPPSIYFKKHVVSAASANETYTGATIRPGADNGVAHLAFTGAITAADYTAGWTLQSRQPSGTWTTTTSWTGALHGDGNKIIVTLTGAIGTWQGSHEFRASFDGTGTLNVDTFTNDATVTNSSTVDLITNCEISYTLDEASGTRADSIGSLDLTDNNTVTQAAGKIGNAAQFTLANAESLTHAYNALFSLGGKRTIATWVYMDSTPTTRMYIAGVAHAGGDTEWYIEYNTGLDRFDFLTVNTNVDVYQTDSNNFGALSLDTWYCVLVTYDPQVQQSIEVNDSTPDTTALGPYAVRDAGDPFGMGRNGAYATLTWDGRMDVYHVWSEILSEAEKTDFYNGGSGKQFPFIPT